MLDATAYQALWGIYDATGIRPEWLVPVLYHESGLNPAATNGAYHGIGQNSPADIQRYSGVDPATYLTWSAGAQLNTAVRGYFQAIVAAYGSLRSGVRIYQAEFLPATLPTARNLSDVIASTSNDPYGFYASNQSLDPNHDGIITLQDLADVVSHDAKAPQVQAALAATYAIRPDETQTDPALGDDFGSYKLSYNWRSVAIAAAILAGSGLVAIYILEGEPKAIRRLRKAIL